MSALDTIQAAIDLAWEYTDDPDECDALSAANQAIEELRAAVNEAQELCTQREALLTTEADTGHLDIDAIHGIEDDAVELVAWLATQ